MRVWRNWIPRLVLTALFLATSARAQYFELRIYDVSSGKMSAVLERFRDNVEPIRVRHGIRTLGYWTAKSTSSAEQFVYLMAAPTMAALRSKEKEFGEDPEFQKAYAAANEKYGKTVEKILSIPLVAPGDMKSDLSTTVAPRAFELRLYSILPDKIDAFEKRWREHAVPIYERHGLHSIGWWTGLKKHPDGTDLFVCLLAGESAEQIQKAIAEFHADPEWQQVEKESEKDGKLRDKVEAFKMAPTDFSLLK